MPTKQNKAGGGLKDRLYDIINLAGYIGIAGIVDYIGGSRVDYPLEDIAVGAGLQAGDAMQNGKTSRVVSSIVAVGLSMYPEFSQLATSGDTVTFLRNAGVKAIGYGAGIAISRFLIEFIKDSYNGMIEVNLLFKNQTEANQAREYLTGIVNVGGYIRSADSSVDEPQSAEGGYSLHARIVGKTTKMQEHLKPSLETYFSKTMSVLEARVSDVVKVSN